MLHEELRTPLPRQVQILHQKTGNDHAHPIVHPTCLHQFAHARINDRITRLTATPRGKSLFRNRTFIVHESVKFTIEILPTSVRKTEHHVGVEIAPSQLITEHIVRWPRNEIG